FVISICYQMDSLPQAPELYTLIALFITAARGSNVSFTQLATTALQCIVSIYPFLPTRIGMHIARHLIATGRVQGVGYRQFLYRQALELDCTGWARNCADGTVEAVIAGAADAVNGLLEAARRGPPGAKVERITVREIEGSYAQFEIRPSA
ncbi:MAG: acylphosphatase, partial [Burkholderiales bacterium]